ncbi:MAG: signal peptide peptidase SppA, partial [Armatimonadota bacterium]
TIALVRIQGLIAESMGGGPFGLGYESGVQSIIDQLERARKDSSVKAVVIRINSPGGSAAASQEIYQAVKRVRGRKPVIVSMGDVAASGGYYVAAGADHIVASPATLTGSIGVIMQTINFEALMERYGVKADTVTSGAYKDTGSMWRKMTEQERKYWQGMVDDVYEQFVGDVAAGRKDKGLSESQLRKLADGRVFTGKQALENKLVDELGGLRTAIEAAKTRAGIKEAHLRELRRKTFFEEVMGAQSGSRADLVWRMLQYERANPARHLLEAPLTPIE